MQCIISDLAEIRTSGGPRLENDVCAILRCNGHFCRSYRDLKFADRVLAYGELTVFLLTSKQFRA